MAGPTFLEWIAGTILLSGTAAARPAATAVPIGTEYYATDTQLRYKSDGTTWNSNSSSGGSSILGSATVTLTDAEVKALPTTAKTILAAPGAGIVRIPIALFLSLDWTANYTNINAGAILRLKTAASGGAFVNTVDQNNAALTSLLASNADAIDALPLVSGVIGSSTYSTGAKSTANQSNAIVELSLNNQGSGNLTGGNAANALKCVALYYDFTL